MGRFERLPATVTRAGAKGRERRGAERRLRWATIAPAAVVAVVPAIVFVALTQKYIVRGLSGGTVKG